MSKVVRDPLYRRHRFPAEIIAHAVCLYYRFPLSLRYVEEMPLERGVAVPHETIRRWGRKFGPDYAKRLRRKQPGRNDVWRPRGGRHHDCRQETLAVARCRPGRLCARRDRSDSA